MNNKYIHTKKYFIKNQDNIVEGVHPSPMARGFIGSNVFRMVENKLGYEINWNNQEFLYILWKYSIIVG